MVDRPRGDLTVAGARSTDEPQSNPISPGESAGHVRAGLYRLDDADHFTASWEFFTVLLLHDNPAAFGNVSPDDMQKVVEKYVAWGNRLREAGVMKAGGKLTDEPGKVMRRRRVRCGSYAEAAACDRRALERPCSGPQRVQQRRIEDERRRTES